MIASQGHGDMNGTECCKLNYGDVTTPKENDEHSEVYSTTYSFS